MKCDIDYDSGLNSSEDSGYASYLDYVSDSSNWKDCGYESDRGYDSTFIL